MKKRRATDAISRRKFVRGTTTIAASSLISLPEAHAAKTREPTPFLTPAEDFYDVSRGKPKPHSLTGQALIDARLTPDSWRLEIRADPFISPPDIKDAAIVETPLSLDDDTALDLVELEELGKKHGVKYIKAMQCLNVAEPLGQGLWEGVPLRTVLQRCGKINNVRRIYYRGFHNDDPDQIFQSSLSYTQVMETPPEDLPVFLAYKLNGEPISPLRGGPVRMIVPWAYGFKSIKWIQEIMLTNDYQSNDTYALKNNDPESFLKTAAYVDNGPEEYSKGEPVTVTGQVISGLSGVERVEYWIREVKEFGRKLPDDAPELLNGSWVRGEILSPPVWEDVLPKGTSPHDLCGFNKATGKPLSWPLRYGMASWKVVLNNLKPGNYEIWVRSVDRNGFAQPEPRPQRRAGKNALQFQRVTVT